MPADCEFTAEEPQAVDTGASSERLIRRSAYRVKEHFLYLRALTLL